MDGQNDGPASQEEQRFEGAVRQQVIDTGHVSPQPARHHHVPELTHGRIGHHALDVVLRQGDRGADEHGDATHDRHDGHGRGRHVIQGGQPRHHKHAGGHHGRGVNQGRNGSGAFHGIRQPHVQRDLRGFSHGADEQQQADQGHRGYLPPAAERAQHVDRDVGFTRGLGEHRLVLQGPEDHEHQQDAEQKPEVTDPVDDKRLGCRGPRRVSLIPVADQQIGAQAHRFPEHEQLEEVVGHDQHQHRKREQRDVGEKPRVTRFAVHVSDGIDVHQSADDGHQQQHGRGQLVHVEPQPDGEVPGSPPGIQGYFQYAPGGDFGKSEDRQQEGQPHRGHRDQVCAIPQDVSGQAEHDEGQKGQERDQGIQHGATISTSGNHRR